MTFRLHRVSVYAASIFGALVLAAAMVPSMARAAALASSVPEFENPVIRGFAPDPSIVRVGEDFYLVTSSFEYFPAIPV